MDLEVVELDNFTADDSSLLLFQRSAFGLINAKKGYRVLDFRFSKKGNLRFSILFGQKDDQLLSPFSAPFGGIADHFGDLSVSDYLDAVSLLRNYLDDSGIQSAHITFPPDCYDQQAIAKQVFACLSVGFEHAYSEVNYHLDLTVEDFDLGLKKVARRCLKIANSHNLEFKCCEDMSSIKDAYAVIKKNREQRGNPLWLKLDDLLEVSKITDVEFFSVLHEGLVVAGAVVYRLSEFAGQVVYWGNDTDHNHLNSIHFLASGLFQYYKGTYELLDIGPSSSKGVASVGLCKFKESLGCRTTLKHALAISAQPGKSKG